MPQVGDRKTKNGITGEWDGTTWRQVDAAPPERRAEAPAIGTRKTKNGITGEWDGTTWRQVNGEDASNPMAGVAAGLGGAAATTAVATPILERIATSPVLSKVIERAAAAGKLMPGVGTGLSTGASVAYGVVKGEDPLKLAGRAATGAVASYGAKLLKEGGKLALRHAQPAAATAYNALTATAGAPQVTTLGLSGAPEVAAVGSAPLAVPLAGGLGGLALSTGLLAGIQHDANREVPYDVQNRQTLVDDIAKVFTDMRTERRGEDARRAAEAEGLAGRPTFRASTDPEPSFWERILRRR